MFGTIGTSSSCSTSGSVIGGTGVTSPAPWPETPSRASFTGRGADEPRRSAAPRRRNGEKNVRPPSVASPGSVPSSDALAMAPQVCRIGTKKRIISQPMASMIVPCWSPSAMRPL